MVKDINFGFHFKTEVKTNHFLSATSGLYAKEFLTIHALTSLIVNFTVVAAKNLCVLFSFWFDSTILLLYFRGNALEIMLNNFLLQSCEN